MLDIGGTLTATNIKVSGAAPGSFSSSVTSSTGNITITLLDGHANDIIVLDGELDTVSNGATNTGYGAAVVQFSNGSTLNRQQLLNLATTGTTGCDTLYGSASGDTFDGKGETVAGSTVPGHEDLEHGISPYDEFLYNPGYGWLEINENLYNASSGAILLLGGTLTASNIHVTSTAPGGGTSGGDLIITDGQANDKITIDGELNTWAGAANGNASFGLSQVEFSNGTVLTRQQLMDMATTGTTGCDTLYGSASGDTFDGKGETVAGSTVPGHEDLEYGISPYDKFVYNPGYGWLEINESLYNAPSGAILLLGGTLTASNIHVTSTAPGSGTSGGDLIITDVQAHDKIIIDGELNTWAGAQNGNASFGVSQVDFSNGTALTRQQLMDMATSGTPGRDTLYGSASGDLFNGEGDTVAGTEDLEVGISTNDRFVYNPGYGNLEINESLYNLTSGAILELGGTLTSSNITVTSTSPANGGNLIITDGTAGDKIIIDNELQSWAGSPFGNASDGVGSVDFTSNGTVLTRQQLLNMATTGTAGTDTLYGAVSGDVFDGKGDTVSGTSDLEVGVSPNDIFIYGPNYGSLTINETAGTYNTGPVLQLEAGILETKVAVAFDASGDAILTDGITGDQITLLGEEGTGGVQQIDFNDGTVWTRQQILSMAQSKTESFQPNQKPGVGSPSSEGQSRMVFLAAQSISSTGPVDRPLFSDPLVPANIVGLERWFDIGGKLAMDHVAADPTDSIGYNVAPWDLAHTLWAMFTLHTT